MTSLSINPRTIILEDYKQIAADRAEEDGLRTNLYESQGLRQDRFVIDKRDLAGNGILCGRIR